MSLKWIYLAKRNPSTDHAEFRSNWRGHSKLASRFAATLGRHFLGVRQCAKMQRANLPTDLPAELVNDYDGVNLVRMRSMQDLRECWSNPDVKETMIPDERRVFSTLVLEFSLFAHEWVELDRAEGSYVLVSFLRRKSGTSRAAFIERWRNRHAPLLLGVPAADRTLRGYRQNHVVGEPPRGYEFDGVAELWFDTPEDALALLADPAYRERIGGDLAQFSEPAAAVTLLAEINLDKGAVTSA
jgi:uncharacterized protein (TIGR02118 family)